MKKNPALNFLRAAILLAILPVMYLGLWISVSAKEMLTYSEKVLLLMSYIPGFARDPFWLAVFFLGLSALSAVFGYRAWMGSRDRKNRLLAMAVFVIAAVLTLWFTFSLF